MSDAQFHSTASQYLSRELEIRKKRRPLYSLRAFARDLSLSPSTLSDLLKDKTGLSVARAQKTSQMLGLKDEEQAHFVDLVQLKNTSVASRQQEILNRIEWRLKSRDYKLSNEDYSLIYDWHHFAILEMLDLKIKGINSNILAERLGLKKIVVLNALKRLYKLNLIRPSGRFFATTSAKTQVGDQDVSLAIQKYHVQILNKSQQALKKQPLQNRNFQTAVFSVRKNDLQSLMRDMNEMTENLIRKYHVKPNKDLVYCLSQQLFSLEEN